MRKVSYVAFLIFISAIDTIRFAGVASFNPQGDQITLEEASVSKNSLLDRVTMVLSPTSSKNS